MRVKRPLAAGDRVARRRDAGQAPTGEGAIRIQVDGHGRILAGGQGPLSLDQLGDEVAKQAGAEGWTEEAGSSRKVLVLEADRTLPGP